MLFRWKRGALTICFVGVDDLCVRLVGVTTLQLMCLWVTFATPVNVFATVATALGAPNAPTKAAKTWQK